MKRLQVDSHPTGHLSTGYDSNSASRLVGDRAHDAVLPERLPALGLENGLRDDSQSLKGPKGGQAAEKEFPSPLLRRPVAQALHLIRMGHIVSEVFDGDTGETEFRRKRGLYRQGVLQGMTAAVAGRTETILRTLIPLLPLSAAQ